MLVCLLGVLFAAHNPEIPMEQTEEAQEELFVSRQRIGREGQSSETKNDHQKLLANNNSTPTNTMQEVVDSPPMQSSKAK